MTACENIDGHCGASWCDCEYQRKKQQSLAPATGSASRPELTMAEWKTVRKLLREEINVEVNSRRGSMGISMYPELMERSQKSEAALRKLLVKVAHAGRPNEKADLPPTVARQPRSGTETTNGG